MTLVGVSPASVSGGCRRAAMALGSSLLAFVVGCASVGGGQPGEELAGSPSPVSVARSPSAVELLGPTGPTEVARVVDITDGDTIRVVIDGEEYRLRYIGIDTPETVAPDQPVEAYGRAATTFNALLVGGEEVVLESDVSETDRFDRLLRYVWLEPGAGDTPTDRWTLVNLELVRAGLAEARDYPPDTKYSGELHVAQAEAREADRGMWDGD